MDDDEETHVAGKPEFVGRFPARTEIPITPGDPNRQIGWSSRIYDGVEVYRFGEDGEVVEVPLTAREDVQEGTVLAVPGVAVAYHRMVVERVEGRTELVARAGEHLFAPLRWAIDDRQCWTVSNLMNTRGLKRLEIQR